MSTGFINIIETPLIDGLICPFRGVYSSGTIYYCTNWRKDIVQYSNSYYITNNIAKSGLSTWSTPSTDWLCIGSSYNSIATGTLITDYSYIKNTLEMGDASVPGIIISYGWQEDESVNGFKLLGGNTPSFTVVGGSIKGSTFIGGTIKTSTGTTRVEINTDNDGQFVLYDESVPTVRIANEVGQAYEPGIVVNNGVIYASTDANNFSVISSLNVNEFRSSGNSNTIYVKATRTPTTTQTLGLLSEAINTTQIANDYYMIGIRGNAQMYDGDTNYGHSIGVYGKSTGGLYSIGVYGEAAGGQGTIYKYAGYFNGPVVTGTLNSTSLSISGTEVITSGRLLQNVTLPSHNQTLSTISDFPNQSGNNGKFLRTDGSVASWENIPGGGDMLISIYDSAGGTKQVAFADSVIPYTGATSNVDIGMHSLTVDTNTFFVDSINHKIGIGTTTPSHSLTIVGTTASIQVGDAFSYTPSKADFVVGSSNSNSRFLFGQSNSFYGGLQWNYNATAASAYLSVGNMNGTNTNGLNILQNGNVGIGTTAPGFPLEVVAAPSSGIQIRGNATTASSYEVGFRPTTTEGASYAGMRGTRTNTPNAGDTELSFFTTVGTVVTLSTSGDVGIGRVSRGYKTDINGTFNATTIYQNDVSLSLIYQPLDADLTSIAALTGTAGFLKTDGAGVWGVDTITLSGDISGSGTNSITTAIGTNKVSLSMMAQITTDSILGRDTVGTGNVEVLSVNTVRTLLSINNVENTALSTWAGSSNIVTVGTITSGSWHGVEIAADHGGTGQTSYSIGDILYATSSSALSKLSDVVTGNALISGGVSTAPSWGKIGLTTHITGTLGVGNGGTGATTLTKGVVVSPGSTTAFTTLAGADNVFPKWSSSYLTDSAVKDDGTSVVITSRMLKTSDYVSRTTAWGISTTGDADFRSVFATELHVQSFIADMEQALAGSQIISKSCAKLYANFIIGTDTKIIVESFEGSPVVAVFADNDYVRLRIFTRSTGTLVVEDLWGTVTLDTTYGTSGFDSATKTQRYNFTRTAGLSSGTINAGTLVLDYGVANSGIIESTTVDGSGGNGAYSPYTQVTTWASTPATQIVRTRSGRLTGLTSVSNDYGFYAGDGGVADTNSFIIASNNSIKLNNVPINLFSSGIQTVSLAAEGYFKLGTNMTTGVSFNFDPSDGKLILGFLANSKSRIELASGAISLISRSAGGSDTTMISLDSSGVGYFKGAMVAGSLADATTTATTNSGFRADSLGNVLVKGNASGSDYIKVTYNGVVDINITSFILKGSTTLYIDTTKIALGTSASTLTVAGTSVGTVIDNDGGFLSYGSSTNYIRRSGTTLDIKSDTFALQASTTGSIGLTASAYTTGNGVWLSSTATTRFRVGNVGASRMQWNDVDLQIYNSRNALIASFGTTNSIASWEVTTTTITKRSGNYSVLLDAGTNPRFEASYDNGDGDFFEMGKISRGTGIGTFGMQYYDTVNSKLYFLISSAVKRIAGWYFTDTSLTAVSNSTSKITGGIIQTSDVTGQKIVLSQSSNDISFYNSYNGALTIKGSGTSSTDNWLYLNGINRMVLISSASGVNKFQIINNSGTTYGTIQYTNSTGDSLLFMDDVSFGFKCGNPSILRVGIGAGGTSWYGGLMANSASGTSGNLWDVTTLSLRDTTSMAQYVGSGLCFELKYKTDGSYAVVGGMYVSKNNSTSTDYNSDLILWNRGSSGDIVFSWGTTKGDLSTNEKFTFTSAGNFNATGNITAKTFNVMRFRGYGTTDPTTDLIEGDVFDNTTGGGHNVKIYSNSAWRSFAI